MDGQTVNNNTNTMVKASAVNVESFSPRDIEEAFFEYIEFHKEVTKTMGIEATLEQQLLGIFTIKLYILNLLENKDLTMTQEKLEEIVKKRNESRK